MRRDQRTGRHRFRLWTGRIGLLAAFVFCIVPGAPAAEDTALLNAFRSGNHVALMRHAIAPGTGDPAAFTLGDCTTQRNLSQAGREQAARIGARLRENGISAARVVSSQWCRCLETARLLGLGPVAELPALNSFFQRMELREPQMRALKAWLADQRLDIPLVLVTHQVNITAFTGVYPSSGEMVIVRRGENGEFSVVGSIETD